MDPRNVNNAFKGKNIQTAKIVIDNKIIEQVTSFNYLGNQISNLTENRYGSEITQIQFYQWNHKATVWKTDVKRHPNQIT
jgi:hypothetical protein